MKSRVVVLVVALLTGILFAATAAAAVATSPVALPQEIITEATYPVTPGESPDVAKQRAYVAAMRLAHAKWVEAAGKLPEVIKHNYSMAELYVAVEALNRPSVVQTEIKTINSEKFYWVKVKNTLDMGNFAVVSGNMADADYVPMIRMIHKALDTNSEAITDLRLQYIYSGSAVDRQEIKKKIEKVENRFESVEWTFSGFVAYINNQLDVAGVDLNKAVTSDPTNVDAYYARGLYYAVAGENDKAIADYSVALKADPKNFDLFSRRAAIYALMGNWTAAASDYSMCLELRPDSVKTYLARANAYDQMGKDDLALSDYNKALAFEPNNYAALSARAVVDIQLKDYDAAIADLTALLKVNPKDVNNLVNRANCYYAKGDTAKALADYDLAMSYGDKDPAKFLEIAQKSYDNKQYDNAINALTLFLRYNAANETAHTLRAKCYDAQNNPKLAIADYTEAIKYDQNNTALYIARANDYYALAATDKAYYDLAAADCGAALSIDPSIYDARLMRGKIYQMQSNYSAAIADYNACIGSKPTADVYNRLGDCYAASGDKNKPRECYLKAIETDPKNPAYSWNLAQFYEKIGRAKSDRVAVYRMFIMAAGTQPQWAQQVTFAKEQIKKLGGKVE